MSNKQTLWKQTTNHLNVCLHVFYFWIHHQSKNGVAVHIQGIFQPSLSMHSCIPPSKRDGGKQSKKAELAKGALRNATTSEDIRNPEGHEHNCLGGHHQQASWVCKMTCDASREPTYFPSSSLEKRKAAASVDSTFAHVMSSDVFVFLVCA
jgi:hypothetical protein